MKTVAIPFVRQIPTLSTRHVPHSLALDELMQYDAETVALYDGGGFVKLRPAAAYLNEFHWLYAIARWAQSNVFDWVQFETEGDVVDGLEVFDWEAGDGRSLFDTVSNVIHPDDNPETGVDIDLSHVVAVNESISHGTHRLQDLIPRFLAALKQLSPAAQAVQYAELPHSYYQSALVIGDDCTWWESTDALELLQDLENELNSYAPPGWYFGTHPGDGSDFGFWANEED